jgi:hypothetical protein
MSYQQESLSSQEEGQSQIQVSDENGSVLSIAQQK